MPKPKENQNKTTIIHWKSTVDELPTDNRLVLAIVDDSKAVFTMKFDCTYGWIAVTDERCNKSCMVKVLFWSDYNFPK
jgi:hypothetical protein